MSGQGIGRGRGSVAGPSKDRAAAAAATPSLRMSPASAGPTGRLPSFKPPRDLSLGSSVVQLATGSAGRGLRGVPGLSDPAKKKFVPNLTVQRRDKPNDSSAIKTEIKQEPGTANSRKQTPQKNRSFIKPELIQIGGSVFADGMGADGAIRRRFGGSGGGGGGEGGSSAIERPKINLKSLDQKFDRAAEEERLKELLRDDFIDDLTTGSQVPVQLPMISTGKVFKEEVKKEEEEVKVHLVMFVYGRFSYSRGAYSQPTKYLI